jgi:ferredoxin-thioredoxin reductase catalytic subunit
MKAELEGYRCCQCRHYSQRRREGSRLAGTCIYPGEAVSRNADSRVCVAFERGTGERNGGRP